MRSLGKVRVNVYRRTPPYFTRHLHFEEDCAPDPTSISMRHMVLKQICHIYARVVKYAGTYITSEFITGSAQPVGKS